MILFYCMKFLLTIGLSCPRENNGLIAKPITEAGELWQGLLNRKRCCELHPKGGQGHSSHPRADLGLSLMDTISELQDVR